MPVAPRMGGTGDDCAAGECAGGEHADRVPSDPQPAANGVEAGRLAHGSQRAGPL